MKQIIIGNRLAPSCLVETVDFNENVPYYLCIKRLTDDDIAIPHYAESVEIVICDNASGVFIADLVQYSVDGNCVIYVPPNCIHGNHFEKGEGTVYVLKISAECLRETVDIEKILKKSGDFTINCPPFKCELFDEIMEEIAVLSKGDGLDFDGARSMIGIFQCLSPYMKRDKRSNLQIGKNPKNRILRKIVDYTEKNFLNGITSKDASSFAGYNRNYFCRWFLKAAGMTYSDYLMRLKINYACRLLENNVTVEDVVEKTGYSNTSFFIKKFKSYTGCTPGNYVRRKEALRKAADGQNEINREINQEINR